MARYLYARRLGGGLARCHMYGYHVYIMSHSGRIMISTSKEVGRATTHQPGNFVAVGTYRIPSNPPVRVDKLSSEEDHDILGLLLLLVS